MKKIYYLDFDFEYNGKTKQEKDLHEFFVSNWGQFGFKRTRKEAHNDMIELYRKAKHLAKGIKDNTITIDLWKVNVDDDFDIEHQTIWSIDDRNLAECRYLCGRY